VTGNMPRFPPQRRFTALTRFPGPRRSFGIQIVSGLCAGFLENLPPCQFAGDRALGAHETAAKEWAETKQTSTEQEQRRRLWGRGDGGYYTPAGDCEF
jgi:hypothetical protein